MRIACQIKYTDGSILLLAPSTLEQLMEVIEADLNHDQVKSITIEKVLS